MKRQSGSLRKGVILSGLQTQVLVDYKSQIAADTICDLSNVHIEHTVSRHVWDEKLAVPVLTSCTEIGKRYDARRWRQQAIRRK